MRAALVLALVVLASVMVASMSLMDTQRDTPLTSQEQPLPRIAPAPLFTLTSQDGAPISLACLRAASPRRLWLGFADSEQPLPVVRPAFDVGAP
jgi:cytochrome oxidase Cu insertion factor (SCO1/SenC/PrrC family)